MDLSKLMDMAKQFQKNMHDAQEKAAALKVTGESGAGMVKVHLNGLYECLSVQIDPAALASQDQALLEDMIRGAINQATVRVAEALKSQMGHMAKAAGLDMSSFLPGDLK
jgi:DNA-binding YbaB/EbfC family protein